VYSVVLQLLWVEARQAVLLAIQLLPAEDQILQAADLTALLVEGCQIKHWEVNPVL
jgi:hypothetical protein